MKTLKNQFDRYGRNLSINFSDGTKSDSFRGFIQPLRYKNKMYLYGVNTEIGYNAQGYYLYLGPPEYDLTKHLDAIICDRDVKYMIDRSEKVEFAGEMIYVWAIIRTVIEENA